MIVSKAINCLRELVCTAPARAFTLTTPPRCKKKYQQTLSNWVQGRLRKLEDLEKAGIFDRIFQVLRYMTT